MSENTQIQLKQSDLADRKMTLLFGAVCSDGVVLVCDTKITSRDGADPIFSEKFTGEIPGVLTGFSGDKPTFTLFANRLRNYVKSINEEYVDKIFRSDYRIIKLNFDIDQLLYQIFKIQKDVITNRGYNFDILTGISKQHSNKDKSLLYHFCHDGGYVEIERHYKVIGSGEPYCSYFMKKYYRDNMKMQEFAQLADFVIRFVSDSNYNLGRGEVGLDQRNPYPQIIYLHNNIELCGKDEHGKQRLDCSPTPSELNEIKNMSEQKLKVLHNMQLSF